MKLCRVDIQAPKGSSHVFKIFQPNIFEQCTGYAIEQPRLDIPRKIPFSANDLFGSQQTAWDCRKIQRCESFPTGVPIEFQRGAVEFRKKIFNSKGSRLDFWKGVLE